MVKSMTGFGKAEVDLPEKNVTIEVKSLNSKNPDLSLKLPYIYRGNETEIRKLLTDRLERGKIELNLYLEFKEGNTSASINGPAVKSFFLQLKALSDDLGIENNEALLAAVLRLPDAVRTEKMESDEKEWQLVKKGIAEAIDQLDDFRVQEGNVLKKDIGERVTMILKYLERVEQYENKRIDKIRDKFKAGLNNLKLSEEFDKNRFEQEIIYFMEKMDITEEKVRLTNHCNFFQETLNDEGSNGKKLGFITQEMGREINTLGSKASDSDIQKLVVLMKDELEKIREQLLNVL